MVAKSKKLAANVKMYYIIMLNCYNGGKKCKGHSSDITKTSDPSPSIPNKVDFGAKWMKMSAVFGHDIAEESGGMTG